MNPLDNYAAIHKNIEVRFDSSSGGVFTALAEAVIKQGGLVGGAKEDVDGSVRLVLVSDKNDLAPLRGIKHQPAQTEGFFESVLSALERGMVVLVCSTTDIIHSLKVYLTKDYDNLYLVDIPDTENLKIGQNVDISLSNYSNFWTLPGELGANLGVNQVSIWTEKGKQLFAMASKQMVCQNVPFAPIQKLQDEAAEEILSPLSFGDKVQAWRTFLGEIRLTYGWSLCALWRNLKLNLWTRQIKTCVSQGKYLIVDKNVVLDLYPKALVKVGGRVLLGHRRIKGAPYPTCIMVENDATIEFRGKWEMLYGSHIEVFQGGYLSFGNGYGNNMNLTILCAEKVEIGDKVALGRNITISDTNGNHYINRRGYKNNHSIAIGNHAWICEGSIVYGGAKIGEGAIVGTRSSVSSHIPAFTMVSGNPAQVIDEDIRWKY